VTPQWKRRYFKLHSQNNQMRILILKILIQLSFNSDENSNTEKFDSKLQNRATLKSERSIMILKILMQPNIDHNHNLNFNFFMTPRIDQNQNHDFKIFVAPKRNPDIG
jgi:hypothetical protein